ncbi:MAG TPA: ATP-dependent DNA helicase RecG [bacterium]|nr:ATP-dependent DNA helicase RecG [bacterium]HPT29833.1 ATP-dependent DNA helicase RecG [bacterium]
MSNTLATKLSALHGAGPTISSRLKKLGLDSIQDLIFYFPWRYDNFGPRQMIDNLKINTVANIHGHVEMIQSRRSFKRRLSVVEALISDESGSIKAIWFNQPFVAKNIKTGDYLSLGGKVTEYHGQAVLSSPVYEKTEFNQAPLHTQGLTPIYATTQGLTQKQIRSFLSQSLPLAKTLPDWIPEDIKKDLGLLDIYPALYKIHFPEDENELRQAKQRLGFGELFLRQLKAQLSKKSWDLSQAPPLIFQKDIVQKLLASLPFALTPDQKQAAWEILQDLEKNHPMARLLIGDVGSGKTIVAILAMLNSVSGENVGHQAALMAPTEILAYQHYQSCQKILAGWNLKIGILTNSFKEINGQGAKAADISLESDIIIGTQALIQKKVAFRNLSLTIVDEQHRFGVRQRQRITQQKEVLAPHFLSLTATPIPRSLALAIYGDLDVSLIRHKPENRQTIITKIVPETQRHLAYRFIGQEIAKGRQAFVICPLIDPSDKLGVKSVTLEHQKLDKEIFPDISVGLLHGKLKAEEKEKIMRDFQNNQIKILVSTSVVEVGVDIQNATIMAIEGASRFGLSQLHQFRGRVGRDKHQSYCLLFPEEGSSAKTIDRLQAMVKFQDGFTLANEDLKLRGAGEIFGTIQSGFPEIRMASLFDSVLINRAQEAAKDIIAADPELKKYPLLKAELGEYEKGLHLE